MVQAPRPRPRPIMQALAAVVVAAGGLVSGCGHSPEPPVPTWIAATAVPLTTTDPAGPLDDLAPLRDAVGDAEIVGLGESVHGASEELTLKHRALRVLVEQLGFRSVAWEEDWTTGRRIDEYITGGPGDPAELVARMSPQWRSREVADVLRWLREFNGGRPDEVRFVGVEYYLTGPDAYDDVDAYVAGAAPERSAELREHLAAVRPPTDDVFAHIQTYTATPDKQPYLRHACAVLDLVDAVPHPSGDRDHAVAVHTARQIVSFYEHFALPEADSHAFRDAHAAGNLQWWQELTADRIAYWAAAPHTANAPRMRIATPDGGELRFRSAGSHLRERYGQRYLSVGFTFDHGSVSGDAQPVALPAPADGWFERPFARAGMPTFVLDLRTTAPPPVRDWLDAPVTTRGPMGPGSYTDGGSASQWFDVVVHDQQVTPAARP
ncbi:erythromycin esterase family protein [Pseudonocardia adelaidensis]|uniref:Erythromycin esterase n=1 Tax=Pseudonocardia adelaidensis TaxID=648754 RepID=A0ABP9PDA3_9PSEU